MQKLSKFLAVGLFLTSIIVTGCSDSAPKEAILKEVGSYTPTPTYTSEVSNVIDLYPNQKLVNVYRTYQNGITVVTRKMREGEYPENYMVWCTGEDYRNNYTLIRERKE